MAEWLSLWCYNSIARIMSVYSIVTVFDLGGILQKRQEAKAVSLEVFRHVTLVIPENNGF